MMAKAKIIPVQRDLKSPFFHDEYTHRQISEIASLDTLVIYAGLGVTIDRTQLNWHGLVDGLLDEMKLTPAQKQAVFDASGGSDIAAASIAYELFVNSQGANALHTMQKRMRFLLYPVRSVADTGQLVAAIGTLMDAWARLGRTIVVVSPNYEDELLTLLKNMTTFPVEEVHLDVATSPSEADRLLGTPGMKYVYLHGSIPDTGTMTRPVLHERDYFETEQSVRGFLGRLFDSASTLFVGTSLTDPPLVAALLASSGAGHSRWSLHPLQAGTWPSDPDRRSDQVGYHDLRLKHLNVKGIYPDYFGQTAQFLHEVRECQRQGMPYESSAFKTRYGLRLCRWWDKWQPKYGVPKKQAAAHAALAKFLEDDLRQILGTTEELKLELWLRWNPEKDRHLALWASSTGTWRNESSMRQAPLEAHSQWVAVNVFTNGRIVRETFPGGRWQAVAGVPLEYTEGDSPSVPIGSIVLASMTGEPAGCLVDPSKAAALQAALEALQTAGQEIVETGKYTH